MACEKKIKICLSPYCSVNYETIMIAKLWRHLLLMIMVAKASHVQFGFSGYAVSMMLIVFPTHINYLEPVEELYSSSFQGSVPGPL